MILNRLKSNIVSFFKRDENKNKTSNKYNEAFFGLVGDAGSGYDDKAKTYIDEGYNVNSIVYSIVNQQARKSASIPFHVKKVEDEQKSKTFLQEIKRKNVTDPQVKILVNRLKKKAFKQEQTFEMPLKKPNVFQSWPEFISLYKTFLKLTGNVYIYMVAPEGGYNKGEPIAFYLLPSHLINIVLKPNANMLLDENPIAFYRLIEGAVFKDFKEENVIHIKYSNPNFSVDGEHLYGQSPLKSALKNIESSNEGMSQNIKTLKNSGAYGFIHGKTTPLHPDQATELKDRLKEMDDNPARLSRIAGVSAEVGFTRLTLTTDELKPFEFLKYDEKQLCNVLGWSDKLLNNDDGSKYKNVEEFRKQVVTDDIMPDLELLERAFNEKVLPRYKKYQNTVIYFDASNLPEMQLDMSTLTSWLTKALKDAVISRAEYREALNYPASDDPLMDLYTTPGKLNTLEDALKEPEPMNPNPEKKNLIFKAGFDPNQQRNRNGEWSKTGGGANPCSFDGWFKDSKAVDHNGEPQKFYHGTTHDFDEFTKDRANPENDFGAGFYFTNSEDDADQNYNDLDGPDLNNRIEREYERIESLLDNSDGNFTEMYDIIAEEYPDFDVSSLDSDMSGPDIARRIANNLFHGGESNLLEVFLSVQNPIILGGESETYFDYFYNEETYEETGLAVDFFEAFQMASAGYYDIDANTVFAGVELYDGISISDLMDGLSKNTDISYATDDNGNLVYKEIVRSAFELMGYDGIIDNTVQRFKMDGVYNDTQHIIVFNPEQIKSTDAESFCTEDPNIYKSLGIEFETKKLIKKKSNFTETIIKSLELYNDPGDITIKE